VSPVDRERCISILKTRMVDVLSRTQRRFNMSRIKSRNTKPELIVRRGLHALGLRYRLHVRALNGRPDLVLRRFKTVVFVHGCFWHAHGCAFSKIPSTRRAFWKKKLLGNAARDELAEQSLRAEGWRVVVLWECSIRRVERREVAVVLQRTANWIRRGRGASLEIAG
jgi:DNA mismatch endonuclease, patch repair protein